MEQAPSTAEAEPIPDGLRWLKLLGEDYEKLADTPTGYTVDDKPVLVRDFDMLCGDHARPLFIGLEAIGVDHPDFSEYQEAAKQMFDHYFRPDA